MPDRVIGAALARMTEPEHEVPPGVLLIQCQRGCAGFKGSLGQFTDRRMRIQIEHVRVGPTQQRMDMRTPLRRCARSGLLQQLLCKQLLAYAHAPQMWKGLCYQFVRVRVIGRLAPQTHRFGHDELRPDRIDDTIGDVILPAEDVGDRAIVAVGPDVNTLGGVDQLRGDPYSIARLAHAAFEDVARPQLAAEFPDVDRFTFAGKGRVTIDNREPLLARQTGDDVLDNPVGKIRLLGIATDIVERQHNNRSPLGPCEGRRGEPRTSGGCALCGYCRRCFSNGCTGRLDGSDKPEAAFVDRSDELLLGSAIADGPPGRADAGAQGRLRNSAALPHGLDQLVFGDNPVVIANEVNEQIENLRLDGYELARSPQLPPRDIDFKSGKTKIQGSPRMACTPQHARPNHRESIASVTGFTFVAAFQSN